MTKPVPNATSGRSFSTIHLGAFEQLDGYVFQHDGLPMKIPGKVFLNKPLGLTGAEISLNKFPVNSAMPFMHKHTRNEETYVFISGEGEFQVDDQVFPVREGTIVRVAPEGVRSWRNTGKSPLYFVVIQSIDGSYNSGDTINDGIGSQQKAKWDK